MGIADAAPTTLDRRRHQMVHPWLNEHAADYFARHAAARGQHPDVFLQRILETIARDDMIAAVLDD